EDRAAHAFQAAVLLSEHPAKLELREKPQCRMRADHFETGSLPGAFGCCVAAMKIDSRSPPSPGAIDARASAIVPRNTRRPRSKIKIRCAICSTNSNKCDDKITAAPDLASSTIACLPDRMPRGSRPVS